MGLLLSLAAACSPATTPVVLTQTPAPLVVQVEMTPALRPWFSELQRCVDQNPPTALVLHESPASGLRIPTGGLAFRYGAPSAPTGYLAPAGEEELVVIVHPDNPVTSVTREELRRLFTGRVDAWGNLTSPSDIASPPVSVWAVLPGDDLGEAFTSAYLPGAGVSRGAHITSSPEEMLAGVAGEPGAVGFTTRRWLDERVKELHVSDADPVRLPVLALADAEPQGPARALLACLQAGTS